MIARATPTNCCCPPDNWIQIFFSDDLKTIECIGDSRGSFALVYFPIRERNLEVLVNSQVIEEMILLENKSDLFVAQRRTFFCLEMMDRGVAKKIFAAPAVIVHSKNVKERGFSSARRAHDRNEFAFLDVDVDVAQDIKEFRFGERIRTFDSTQLDHNLGIVTKSDHRIGPSGANSRDVTCK